MGPHEKPLNDTLVFQWLVNGGIYIETILKSKCMFDKMNNVK